jgi:23S rRNA (guanosine2251-2'-O)-methyltransferase
VIELLYGRNAVRECLRARRRHIHKLLLAKGIKPNSLIEEIINLAQSLQIPIQEVSRQKLDGLFSSHQGIALEVGKLPTFDLTDLLKYTRKLSEPAFILALDHIEDPHNLGALLRTAEAVGIHGIIIPSRRAVGITPAVVNASAGASEYHRITIVANLVQTLQKLKKEDIWIVGVEKTSSAQPYHQVDLNMPLALVLGSEGRGMSRLVSQTCDFLMSIPMRGRVESLNASVAGAIALYEAWRARQFLTR